MACGPCSRNAQAITDASQPLINNFGSNSQFSPVLTQLLRALDEVEIRMRSEAAPAQWKPSQFEQVIVPYGRKPEGTEVVARSTPLYFENNNPFVYDLRIASPEGGICEGSTMCAEPPANQVPGDTWQSFTWRMQGTAWETPLFCLKDLLHYENGTEVLANFLKNVERIPSSFYNNYIRNLIWDTGEKYFLAATDVGLLWNSPDRVSARVAPNIVDFRALSPAAGTADIAAPKLTTIQYLEYILESFLGDDLTPLNVGGDRKMMMVGVKPDIFNIAYNDTDVTPANWAQGGMGFNLFDFAIIEKLPFAVKYDDAWFRGDFDAAGEFYRVPAKVYVAQNGGSDLRTNPAWLTAPYGVLTFMTQRPFKYRRFGALPNMPSMVDPQALRYLSPRFQWGPLLEKCSYTRGLVQWRAEDEFGFQPTGEKIIHVIYRRDELSAFIREAKAGVCPEVITDCRVAIPETCAIPEVGTCCPVPGAIVGAVDYRDTAYTISYPGGGLVEAQAWDVAALPITTKFQTVKGTFDVIVTNVNTAGTLVTFYVDPAQHTGGHFCCEDQLLGFVLGDPVLHCQARLEGGLRPDPWDNTNMIGMLSHTLDVVATNTVAVFFDGSCGIINHVEATVDAIDNVKRRITLTFDPLEFPDGIDCEAAVKVCAFQTVGCESCVDDTLADCVPTAGLTPISFSDDDHEENS